MFEQLLTTALHEMEQGRPLSCWFPVARATGSSPRKEGANAAGRHARAAVRHRSVAACWNTAVWNLLLAQPALRPALCALNWITAKRAVWA